MSSESISSGPSSTAQQVAGRLGRPAVLAWRNAVFAIFFACGIGLSSWVARVPHVRDLLSASTWQMGLLVLAISIGSIGGLIASGHVISALGARRTMAIFYTLLSTGLVVAGVGTALASFAVIAVGLFIAGSGMGISDVSMNVNGAAAERVLGQSVMPIFHAFFSFGTMAGAGIAAAAEALRVPMWIHLLVVAVVLLAIVQVSLRSLQPETLLHVDDEGTETRSSARERLGVWLQPATLGIGLIVLGTALAEGSANDWLSLAMVDGHQMANAQGALMLGVFLTAMTIARVLGVRLLDRFGRVPVVRGTLALALVGLAITIFSPWTPLAVVGVVLWGFGSALGFPVGMSAAADDPRQAAARVSAVATIGYLAFLVGPVVIGFLGEHFGVLRGLLFVLVLVVAAFLAAPAVREPEGATIRHPEPGS